jgi:hypothetical protein
MMQEHRKYQSERGASVCVFNTWHIALKNFWEMMRQTFNESFMKEHLLYIVLDLEWHALVLSR